LTALDYRKIYKPVFWVLKKNEKKILLLVIIIVAISASIFSLTVLKQTTEVDTIFISGTIQ